MSYLYVELLLLWRRAHTWLYPLCFFAIIMCLFPLAFTPDPVFLKKYLPGCVWIAALFASLLTTENIFLADLEDGYLEQILLGEIPLSLIVFIKIIAQWLMIGFPLILVTFLFSIMSNLSLNVTLTLCLSLLAGTPTLMMIGALIAALTIGLRQQGAILGLLILPLSTPILIFGVNITQQVQAGFAMSGPLAFLAGLGLLTLMLMPWAIATALTLSCED